MGYTYSLFALSVKAQKYNLIGKIRKQVYTSLELSFTAFYRYNLKTGTRYIYIG